MHPPPAGGAASLDFAGVDETSFCERGTAETAAALIGVGVAVGITVGGTVVSLGNGVLIGRRCAAVAVGCGVEGFIVGVSIGGTGVPVAVG